MSNRTPPDLEKLLAQTTRAALRKASTWLDQRFSEELSSNKWDWPVEPSPRDIVNNGQLRASQTRQVQEDGSVVFSWPVEYATPVHDGYVTRQGRRRMPGRPWTRQPLEELPAFMDRVHQDELNRRSR